MFCEAYEQRLEMTRREYGASDDLGLQVDHLMEKLNFQEALARGAAILGRPDLADTVRTIRRNAAPA